MTERPVFELRIRQNMSGKNEVWDPLRKKFIVLTPEEWVRQQFILYLTETLKYPKALISVEKAIQYNGLVKRIDLMVSDRKGQAFLLAEFKSPEVPLNEKAVFQSALYNHTMGAKYIVLDNHVSALILHTEIQDAIKVITDLPLPDQL